MTDRPLRLGVIGVGHLGRHHARLAATLDGAVLAAVVDQDEERARAAAAPSGAHASADARELLDRVDAVVIAVPTVDHLAVAKPFLERGVHVLVEKPMAALLDEADEMIDLARRSGATLAVGHSERFNPAVLAAMAHIRAPRFIEVHRLSGFPERSLDIDVVLDVMIHDLDIVLAMDGTDVASVEAVGAPVLTSKVDIANARVRFTSGCIANITASRVSHEKMRKIRVFQAGAYVSIDCAGPALEVGRLRPRPGERPAIEGGPVPFERAEPLKRELQDFVDAVRDRRAPRVTGEDGRRALRLATRVTEAMAASPWPTAAGMAD
jgi:predicted dehydrogenase